MPDGMLLGKGGLRECQAVAVMRSPVVSRDFVGRIRIRIRIRMETTLHVQEYKY